MYISIWYVEHYSDLLKSENIFSFKFKMMITYSSNSSIIIVL